MIIGIPVLAPGDYRILTWGQYGGLSDALGGEAVTVVSRFKSRDPYLWGAKERQVESVLEVQSFTGTDATASSERNAVKALDTIAKQLKTVAGVLKEPAEKDRYEEWLRRRGEDERGERE